MFKIKLLYYSVIINKDIMSENKNVSAIRLGDKLIIFINGKRQVISKSVSPETFDVICEYISKNEVEKISNIFNDFQNNLSEYLKEFFEIEEGNLKDNFHNKPHHFSKLLIRKGTELLSLKGDVKPLYKLSKKIFFASENMPKEAHQLFNEITSIGLTKEGNLLLPIVSFEEESYENLRGDLGVVGMPIKIRNNEENIIRLKSASALSLDLHKKNHKQELKKFALINPFDIYSFTTEKIHISRYKIYDKSEIENIKGIVEIKNEKLFDISYNIFEKNYKNI